MRMGLKRLIAGVLFSFMILNSVSASVVYAEESNLVETQNEMQEPSDNEENETHIEENEKKEKNDVEEIPDGSDEEDISENKDLDTIEDVSDNEIIQESENSSSQDDQNAGNEITEQIDNNLINFLYIESPYLMTPNTQRIVIDFEKTIFEVDKIVLVVSDELGNKSEWPLSKQLDGMYLFEKNFTGDAYTGTYHVESLNIFSGSETKVLDFQKMNIDAQFGVNTEYDGYDELQPLDGEDNEVEGEIETSIVTIDENGLPEAQNSIEDALNRVSAETGSANILSRTSTTEASAKNGKIIVALDPGHDSRSTGASGNGLREEELTLKIANYCKEELEQYAGVDVYMTRTGSDCPFQMNGAGCIEKRVNAAADAGAQIFVSFHLNSSVSSSAKGAEVIIQNDNWRPDVASESRELAEQILNELVKLGLSNRGIYSRDSSDTQYADGSKADYFSVQRNCKLRGIPGIIIEHAFISNSGDANNFLKTEAGLKSLGVADATGIANYLGLVKMGEKVAVKDGTYAIESLLGTDKVIGVSNDSWDSGKTIALYENGDKSSQRFEVISTGDGFYNIIAEHSGKALEIKGGSSAAGTSIQQNTLDRNSQAQKWYFINAGDNQYYICSAVGTYMDVQSALTSNGTPIWAYSFNGSDAQKWKLLESDYHPIENGTYTISNKLDKNKVLNIDDGSNEDYANVNLFTSTNSAEQRFEITYVGGGYYKIIAEHSKKSLDVFSALTVPGTNLQQYTWNNSNAQLWKFVGAGDGTYYIRSKVGTVIDLEAGQAITGANVCMQNISGTESQKWYLSESEYRPVEDGQYYITSMNSPYNVMFDNNGELEIGMYSGEAGQLFEISYVSQGYYRITSVKTSKVLDVKNGSSSAGADLWTYAWNGSDAQLWKFIENDDGSYILQSKLGTVVDICNGMILPGTNIQMYTLNGTNAQKWCLEKNKGSVDLQPIPDGTYKISNISGLNQVLDVNCSLESDFANVQTYLFNDTSAQRFEIHYVGNGYYQITAEHSGKVLDVANASKYAGANVWQYRSNSSDAQMWRILDAGDGSYYIQSKLGTVLDLNESKASSGSNVQTNYMSASNTQKWKFEESEYQPVENGMYTIRSAVHSEYTVDIANASKNNMGNAWLYNYNGTSAQRFVVQYIGGGYYKIECEYSGKVLDIANGSKDSGANVWQYEWNGSDAQLWKFIKTDSGYYIRSKLGTVLDIYSSNYSAGTNVQTSTANNLASQKWVLQEDYPSKKIEEGTYIFQTYLDKEKVLDVANASTLNCGNIQIYANNSTSAQKFRVEEVEDGYYKIESENSGKVLDISNGSRYSGANVWQYEWNGSNAQLWRFVDAGNGAYYIQSKLGTVLDVFSGLTQSGTNVQVYELNKTNAQKWILKPVERQLYKIMGTSNVTAYQMAEFFKKRSTVVNQYPYSNVAEAPTIEKFCEIYIDECQKEGVKAEVAFCQAMLETGFLKFGNDVKKEQYNFAGLGAVGGGASGASFNSIREGIRAQVQHLKAYASTESLNQEIVDPRFQYVKRGSAIYVEWLGQKENPNGYGWAASAKYGYNIVDYYIVPLIEG